MGQGQLKITVLKTKVKPGQTIEEAVKEELLRAEERKSVLARSSSLRNGVTEDEARKALDSAEV